jgi:quercetin dioxygenase-like cupin family protein
MREQNPEDRRPVFVRPDEGRAYDMGRMRAVFFADGEETEGRYSISEWWLEPRTPGPHEHAHRDDHIFIVLEGTVRLTLDGVTRDAPRGSYAVIPGGIAHRFENPHDAKCGFVSINLPAGFEEAMPSIVGWFAENPLEEMEPTP